MTDQERIEKMLKSMQDFLDEMGVIGCEGDVLIYKEDVSLDLPTESPANHPQSSHNR